jgi:hypothetical protein
MNKLFLLIARLIILFIGGFFILNSYIYNGKQASPPDDGVGEFWGNIYGTVLLGPVCPVMMDPPDPQCADKPYATSLDVTTIDGSRVIKQFSSDGNGRFNIEIPPGQYVVRSAATANILPYCQSNGTFTVGANDSTEVTISCDTGIR